MKRGIFAVYKPAGITSAQVTNVIKRLLLEDGSEQCSRHRRKVKVGHGGTLDKDAEGVLVIGVGEDCKRLGSFLQGEKEYEAVGRLGVATDTLDGSGAVVKEAPWDHVTRPALVSTLERFEGDQLQVPPVMSALKVRGERMSDLARRGKLADMVPKPRPVTITRLELKQFAPPDFRILVACSKGTYIRSLINDIGVQLKSAAHMKSLCRTRQGQAFTLENALTKDDWTLEKITDAALKGDSIFPSPQRNSDHFSHN